MDTHWGDYFVRYLNTHHGDFVRNRGNSYAGGTQGQSDIVGQISQLIQFDALFQGQFIPGNRRPSNHVDNIGIDAEGVNGVPQTLTVGVQFP